MTFYIIGLGLNKDSLTAEALDATKKCKKVYLENYTVNFPYKIKELEKQIGKKIEELNREKVESEDFLDDAKKQDIALLIYGSPLAATTHISLILKCKKDKIKYKIIQNASIFDAIAETGLQMYKFGKTTSLPTWKESFKPESFIKIIEENQSINAHSLILVDIGLESKKALEQFEQALKNNNLKIDKMIIFSNAGTENSKIFYDTLENLKNKKVEMPFCIIIPGKLHFAEQESLEILSE